MYSIEMVDLEYQPAMVVRGKARVAEIPEFLGQAYSDVEAWVAECELRVTGMPFARYQPLDEECSEFEIEAGITVAETAPVHRAVEPSHLPAGRAATTWHVGPYEAMEPAYREIGTFLAEHGHVATGAAWEVYHSDPDVEPEPATWRTQIFQPCEPAT